MKFKTIHLIFLLAFFTCAQEEVIITRITSEEEENPNETPAGEWELIFEDNFDDATLPDWTIWEGGAFNNEIQLYNSNQLEVENGILTITANREAVQGPATSTDNTLKSFEYVSGRIETKKQYGPSNGEAEKEYRFICRMKLPKGNGMWPAFWSFSDPWPTNGEIDILEARGNKPLEFQSNIFYGTQVGTPLTKPENTEKVHNVNFDLTEDFHTYELIWKEDTLEILLDGSQLHTYTANAENFIASLFGKKHQIVLNLAVGGAFFSGINSTEFIDTSQMSVDWVRVYKR